MLFAVLFVVLAAVFFGAGFLVVVFFADDAFLVAVVDVLDFLVAKVHPRDASAAVYR